MVAELAGIFTATVDGKAASDASGGTSKQRKRPRWIQTATREPIYSILDSNGIVAAKSLPPGVQRKIVIISAVKNEPSRKSDAKANEQRKLSCVCSPSRGRTSPILEVEDEDTLYSVVRKPKKVRLPETSSDEELSRPIDKTLNTDSGEKFENLLNPEDASKRIEVRKWLGDTPGQSPTNPRKMYADQSEYENPWPDRENPLALPRGVVGLVGPYRVYGNPNERREYMLQEEELVEEVVDSASEKVQEEESRDQHRQRAKWKIREDDEETLVPDIRELPSLESFAETKMEDEKSGNDDWKDEQRSVSKMEKSGYAEGILSGKEERAVDVPDTVSAVSTTPMKDKWGEKICLLTIA